MLSLQLDGGRWLLWEEASCLPGLADYAFCSLTACLWCFRVSETLCQELSYFPGESTARAEGDLLQCLAQKLCVRSDHSTKVQ